MSVEEFGQVAAHCCAAAVQFQQGRWREGLQAFQAIVPAVQAGLGEISAVVARRGLELDEIRVNDLPLASLIRSLQSILIEVNGAVKKRDWIAVADLLEEDLGGAVEALHSVLLQLSRTS